MKTFVSKSIQTTSNNSQTCLSRNRLSKPITLNPGKASTAFASHPFLQPKLQINKPGDKFEQEADRVANAVIHIPPRESRAGMTRSQRGSKQTLKTLPKMSANIDVIKGGGEPLSESERAYFYPRVGHDFSRIRVHKDTPAAESAQNLNARAFTIGRDIVFNRGQYEPSTANGKRLLAHELTHTVQQSLHPAVASNCPNIQRNDNDEEESELRGPGLSGLDLELHLDPELEVQARAIRLTHELLSPPRIRSSLLEIDPASIIGALPPPWLPTSAPEPEEEPLVPRGQGPEEPQAGTAGDIFRAVIAIPAVELGISTIRTRAVSELSRNWRGLSTGERTLVISHSVVLAGGALAGILAHPESR